MADPDFKDFELNTAIVDILAALNEINTSLTNLGSSLGSLEGKDSPGVSQTKDKDFSSNISLALEDLGAVTGNLKSLTSNVDMLAQATTNLNSVAESLVLATSNIRNINSTGPAPSSAQTMAAKAEQLATGAMPSPFEVPSSPKLGETPTASTMFGPINPLDIDTDYQRFFREFLDAGEGGIPPLAPAPVSDMGPDAEEGNRVVRMYEEAKKAAEEYFAALKNNQPTSIPPASLPTNTNAASIAAGPPTGPPNNPPNTPTTTPPASPDPSQPNSGKKAQQASIGATERAIALGYTLVQVFNNVAKIVTDLDSAIMSRGFISDKDYERMQDLRETVSEAALITRNKVVTVALQTGLEERFEGVGKILARSDMLGENISRMAESIVSFTASMLLDQNTQAEVVSTMGNMAFTYKTSTDKLINSLEKLADRMPVQALTGQTSLLLAIQEIEAMTAQKLGQGFVSNALAPLLTAGYEGALLESQIGAPMLQESLVGLSQPEIVKRLLDIINNIDESMGAQLVSDANNTRMIQSSGFYKDVANTVLELKAIKMALGGATPKPLETATLEQARDSMINLMNSLQTAFAELAETVRDSAKFMGDNILVGIGGTLLAATGIKSLLESLGLGAFLKGKLKGGKGGGGKGGTPTPTPAPTPGGSSSPKPPSPSGPKPPGPRQLPLPGFGGPPERPKPPKQLGNPFKGKGGRLFFLYLAYEAISGMFGGDDSGEEAPAGPIPAPGQIERTPTPPTPSDLESSRENREGNQSLDEIANNTAESAAKLSDIDKKTTGRSTVTVDDSMAKQILMREAALIGASFARTSMMDELMRRAESEDERYQLALEANQYLRETSDYLKTLNGKVSKSNNLGLGNRGQAGKF